MLFIIFVCGINLAATTSPQITYEDSIDLQEYRKVCGIQYSLACLKADLVRLIELLSRSPPVQVMPGISVSSSGIRANLIGLSQRTADDLLISAITDFFRSITIHVSLFNEHATAFFRGDTEGSYFTGRLRKYKFLTIYTVFAIAFALLSAIVGKAMTLSIVSLIISMVARNGGIGNNAPNSPPAVYDIVRRPQIQFANTHSSEEIFEGARTVFNPYTHAYSRLYGRDYLAKPYTAYLQQSTPITNRSNFTNEEILG